MWSIGMSTGEVGNCLFGVREVAQWFLHMVGIIMAFLVDQVFQLAPLPSGINNIIYFIFLILIFYDV